MFKIPDNMVARYPKMYTVRQSFKSSKLNSIEKEVFIELNHSDVRSSFKPKQKIAVSVGSRGISDLEKITRSVINQLLDWGCQPFIIPAMGSHGNAEAEGQKKVLENYGIREETMGVPVISSMEVVQLGMICENIPVYFDKIAANADGIVVINRIKPHTDFTGDIESGLIKMMVIGLGNHIGCTSIHSRGPVAFKDILLMAGRLILNEAPIVMGLAIVEDAYDQVSCVKALLPHEMEREEKKLLLQAKGNLPSFPVNKFDVLIVEEIGKDISGAGMDTKIIGRMRNWGVHETMNPFIKKIVVLNLTEKSYGNAIGLGLADIIPRTLMEQVDFSAMYTNALAGNAVEKAFVPLTTDSERDAIAISIMYSRGWEPEKVRLIIIKNTLLLEEIEVSETIWEEIKENKNITLIKGPYELEFEKGFLVRER